MQLTLQRRVSRDTNAEPDDVRALKKALNRLGYYMPDKKNGITKIADATMIDGLKEFQRDQKLKPDGIILPDGETAKALNKALAEQVADKTITLQWHCAGDQNSCNACIAHDGTLVQTDSENTPNCPGSCRCWVTPLRSGYTYKIYDPPIQKVYPELILIPASRIKAVWKAGIWLSDKTQAKWIYGKHKSAKRWSNQFSNRKWTEKQVTDTIRHGKTYPAPNKVNPQNGATRYEYKERFVVRDNKTKELLQVGEKHFIRNKLPEKVMHD